MSTGLDVIQCEWPDCGAWFRRGTGHVVACCCGTYPICNQCYENGKKSGVIKDKKFKKSSMSIKIKESLK
jgi:hypothetical protein